MGLPGSTLCQGDGSRPLALEVGAVAPPPGKEVGAEEAEGVMESWGVAHSSTAHVPAATQMLGQQR